MSNKIKELRGQLRILVKEMLPEIIKEVLFEEAMREVKKRLDAIDERQREITAYMIRNNVK